MVSRLNEDAREIQASSSTQTILKSSFSSAKSKIESFDDEAERVLQRTRAPPPMSWEVAVAKLSIFVPALFQLN
jgi:hypothetical protein